MTDKSPQSGAEPEEIEIPLDAEPSPDVDRPKGKRKFKPRRLHQLPLNSLLPNMLTTMALCAGLTSIRFALNDEFQAAVAAILIAGVLDSLDGRVARLLKGSSRFGAELDSLCDLVNFGVAPAVVLYLWTLNGLGGFGWVIVLAFAVCCALRLARFNTMLEDPDRPEWDMKFFVGVPAPAGAAMTLWPVACSFVFGDTFFREPWFVGLFMLCMAGLMVSQIHTFSFKKVRVKREWAMIFLLIVGILVAMLISFPWSVLAVIGIAYLSTLPFGEQSYRKHLRQWEAENAVEES